MELNRSWWTIWAAAFAAPLFALGLLLTFPSLDGLFMDRPFHFYVVSATALAAAAACAVIVALTRSLRETRLLFLGLAFMSIAAIFSVHGLDTPGHIHDRFHAELAISSWLSIFAAAVFATLSVLPLPENASGWLKKNGGRILCVVALLLGVYIGMAIASPDWLAFLPYRDRAVQLSLTVLTMSLLAFSAWRYFQGFLFARLLSQWAMVVVLVMLMEAHVSITWGRLWHYSWWLYHGTYAAAFVILFAAWFLEARRAGSLRVISDGLSMRDAIAQLNLGYSRAIADLVDAIEWKDLYTLGHVRRVASYALMMGKELSLPTMELRALALGAQMHDVGKIGVPDKILMKPGHLGPEEFEVIKEHVARGYEIATRVSALSPVTDAIRYHHERWDGDGYPEGLRGEAIPLHARIVAVADAFDAMTSGRVYQPAKSSEEAIEELRRCAGAQFDPRCVEAFTRALSKAKTQDEGTRPRAVPSPVREAAA